MAERFTRGEVAVWRSRPDGAVGYTLPTRVVQDTPKAIVLFQPDGTICKKRVGIRGGPRGRNMVDWSGEYEDVAWRGPSVLRMHVPGTSHAIVRDWEGGTATGWYINLERLWSRTSIGFDSFDLVLDIEVSADLSTWRWKDEDELEWSIREGKLSSTQADLAREEGERVARAIERRSWPFDADWSRWAPDRSWTIPSLPDGWKTA